MPQKAMIKLYNITSISHHYFAFSFNRYASSAFGNVNFEERYLLDSSLIFFNNSFQSFAAL